MYCCASARVAQLVEQRFRKAWVASSILASGSCVGIYFLFSNFLIDCLVLWMVVNN
ncbi:MAG: hypothetical protein RIQ54_377 [Candidatus Parcubacteria bacterium]